MRASLALLSSSQCRFEQHDFDRIAMFVYYLKARPVELIIGCKILADGTEGTLWRVEKGMFERGEVHAISSIS